MSIAEARVWIVRWTLGITLATLLFILLGRMFGYPLQPQYAARVAQIVLPVFLGYLGAASQFVFRPHGTGEVAHIEAHGALLTLMIKGPPTVFATALVAVFIAFGFANRTGLPDAAQGMHIDELAAWLTAIIGLLAATTNFAVAYLFSVADTSPEAH